MTPQTKATRALALYGAIASAIGVALTLVGALVDLRQALFSYLVAWVFGFTIALGALAFSMISYITHAKWLLPIRRLVEAITVTIPLFALGFIPIALGARTLYLWAQDPSHWDAHTAEQVHLKAAYLNLPFWRGRAIVVLTLWSVVAMLLRRWSLRFDQTRDPAFTSKRRALSGAAAPLMALTFTFACFDWTMSLDPTWTSNAYGFYMFGAGFLGAASVIAIIAHQARRIGAVPREVSASHFHAVGNVMLAMTVFWAYIAFVQLLLIWIADLPEEVPWYAIRSHGSWGAVCVYLGVGHFVIPFMALLMRNLKRDPKALTYVAALLLVGHFVDMHWLIMPTLHPEGLRPHWLDLAALLAVSGAAVAFASHRYAAVPALPQNEPGFADSIRFEMS